MTVPWGRGDPTNFQELFSFYNDYVKLLYSEVQVANVLPAETVFELNAAFDHVSRHWTHNESEKTVVSQAFSHLKLSCFDIFKLRVREARHQYDALCQRNISVIDNGEFEQRLHSLFAEIRQRATNARQLEGGVESLHAFETWEAVYLLCQQLENEFFLNPNVSWAHKRTFFVLARQNALGFAIGLLTSIVATLVVYLLTASH